MWTLKQADSNKDIPIDNYAQITFLDIQLSTGFETLRLYVKNLNAKAYYRSESSAQINQSLGEFLNCKLDPGITILRRLKEIEDRIKMLDAKLA